MATPGWYPDPSGRPGAYRYWDGQAWGDDVTDNPYGGPSTPPTPPTPDAGNPFAAPTVFPGSSAASSETPASSEPPESDHTVVAGGPSGPPPSSPPPEPPTPPSTPTPPSAEPTQVGWASAPAQPSWEQQPAPYQGYQQPGASYGQPAYAQPHAQPHAQPFGGPPPKSGSGKTVGIVLLAVVLVVAIGIGTFFVVRGLTDDGDDTARDDESSQTDAPTSATTESDPTTDPTESDPTESDPTDDPTDDPAGTIADPGDPFTDGVTPVGCTGGTPTQGVTGEVGGTWTGGGLSVPKVPGYLTTKNETVTYDQSAAFVFADGVLAPSREIEAKWASVYALGGLKKTTFADPGAAAASVLECMSVDPRFYSGLTGAELLDSKEIEVDGSPAWEMDADIRVSTPDVTVPGDIAKVIVVDTGDPQRWGMFVSVVPIGDDALIAQQQSVAESLTVG